MMDEGDDVNGDDDDDDSGVDGLWQADVLGVGVMTPQTTEATSLGAAFAAGLAVGFWKNFEELRWVREPRMKLGG
jgi:glycerol kinase